MLAGGPAAVHETINELPSGERRAMRISKRLLRNPDGSALAVVGVMMDISDLRQAQEQAESARQAAQRALEELSDRERAVEEALALATQALRVKSSIMTNLSHELRTPISGIIGFADLMLVEDVPEPYRQMAAAVAVSGRRLNETVDVLLELADLETDAGRAALHLNCVNLTRQVDKILRLITHRAEAKGLVLFAEMPTDLLVLVDGGRLRSIVFKLVDNAIKFTRQGKVGIRIAMIAADDKSEILEISVADTGIGIDPKDQGALFKDFSQIEVGYIRSAEGMGLGLAVCRRHALTMSGQITVNSVPGIGSRFSVRIPPGTAEWPLSAPGDVNRVVYCGAEADAHFEDMIGFRPNADGPDQKADPSPRNLLVNF